MGMLIQEHELNATSNNLANVNTVGYKRDRLTVEEFPKYLEIRMNDTKIPEGRNLYTPPRIGKLGAGVIMDRVTTDHEPGTLRETGNNTDFAVTGKSYFMVQTPRGIRFTKDGQFQVNSKGELVTRRNENVLAFRGGQPPQLKSLYNSKGELSKQVAPVVVGVGNDFHVDLNGRVFVEGEESGQRMLRMSFKDTNQIEKEGHNQYKLIDGEALYDGNNEIRQRFLETGNVNIVTEMVNMIKVSRAYESNSKILKTIDEKIGQAVKEVGSAR
jgi:flagellar basal-body rod protein FlgG